IGGRRSADLRGDQSLKLLDSIYQQVIGGASAYLTPTRSRSFRHSKRNAERLLGQLDQLCVGAEQALGAPEK
ncbi:MAG TPA: hypothetical protein VN516_00905, partial [Candidatus Baltobacteraceae bacterium]|nr:hypothetical protein [Candidatus Baltobacteraceae bacterium]